MAYDTKKLFRNAAQVLLVRFGNLYSEGQEVPRRKPRDLLRTHLKEHLERLGQKINQ